MPLDHFLYFIYGFATCALLVFWRLLVWDRKNRKTVNPVDKGHHDHD